MAAFQFPDPSVETTVVNPITGSTYQWQDPPGKWSLTFQNTSTTIDIISEGDTPPSPVGDYKLWYSTDSLELYFYYTDINGNSAWLPTSKPTTMLDDLDTTIFELRRDLTQVNEVVTDLISQIAELKQNS